MIPVPGQLFGEGEGWGVGSGVGGGGVLSPSAYR